MFRKSVIGFCDKDMLQRIESGASSFAERDSTFGERALGRRKGPPACEGYIFLSSNLRLHLREATAPQHKELDESFSALDLTKASDYGRFLRAQAAALLPLEQALEASDVRSFVKDWEQRSRRSALLSDLAALGLEPPSDALTPPAFGSPSEIWGCLYVLEGSRLGARFLVKTVLASPDARVSGATAFLQHGQNDKFWDSFLAALEEHAFSASEESLAVEGAQKTFRHFSDAAKHTIGK
jgi:heme oxygenase